MLQKEQTKWTEVDCCAVGTCRLMEQTRGQRWSAVQWVHTGRCMEQATDLAHVTPPHSTVQSPLTHVPLPASQLRADLRPSMSCWANSANSMASTSTPHVGGWKPLLPPHHLVSPSCTAPSSFKGWAVKHAAIVDALSPTPSRTALPLPAALLLTYFLKSMRWRG